MLYIVLSTMMFAFGPILVRMGLEEGLQPNHLVALRLAVAFPFFLLAVVLTGSLVKAKLSLREGPFLFFIGVVCMGGAMFCFFHSISYLGASVASLIGSISPAVTAVMAYFIHSRPITAKQVASMAASFVGVIFLVAPTVGLTGLGAIAGSSLAGVGYSLAAILLASSAALGFERYVEIKSPLIAAFHITGFMLAFMGPIFGFPETHFSPKIWTIVLLLGTTTWFIPFLLMFYGIREIGASGATLVQNLGPLVTVAVAGAMFGETLFPSQLAGMALILSSLYVFALDRKGVKDEVFTIPEA